MTKRIRIAFVFAAAATIAVTAFALSDEYNQFANGPAQFLMTKQETAQWKAVKTDDEAKAFVDAFWLRRDPNPATPANEFKTEFEARVKYADEHFAQGRRKGSLTDRGHVLIVLGGPAKLSKDAPTLSGAPRINPNVPTDSTQDTADRPRGKQVWTYELGKTPSLSMPVLEVAFVDSLNNEDWKLERTRSSGDYNVVFEHANEFNSAPRETTTTTTTTTETKTTTGPAAAVPPATLKSAAYQAAVDAERAGKSAIDKNVYAAYVELVAPTGEFYVPLQLFIPKSSALTPDSADTFFGLIEDSTGKAVYSFEEPAKLTTSKDEQFVDRTVNLPTGKYTAFIGLAKGDSPVVITTKTLDINETPKEATGTSALVLSNNVFETEKAAPVKAPFAFGRLKIVPKANLSFTTADELTYFVELHNPGIDPATNLPKVQIKLELSGGKLTKPIPRPLSDIAALPLSGTPGPGQYAIIDSIQLEGIKSALSPGDYLLKVKIVDTISKQTYNLEQKFKITN
jgi:GWxTD domain-containing protein